MRRGKKTPARSLTRMRVSLRLQPTAPPRHLLRHRRRPGLGRLPDLPDVQPDPEAGERPHEQEERRLHKGRRPRRRQARRRRKIRRRHPEVGRQGLGPRGRLQEAEQEEVRQDQG